MRLKFYKMAMSILPKFLTLKGNISRTIWRIEVGDGSFFCIFHTLSFELNVSSDRRFPLNTGNDILNFLFIDIYGCYLTVETDAYCMVCFT